VRVSWLLCLCLSLCFVSGCDQPSGTGGRAIRFDVTVRGAPQAGQPLGQFTTATGWDVSLDVALIALGPIYLYENSPPMLAQGGGGGGGGVLGALRALWLPQALAHLGDQHFSGGRVMGEALQQHVIDLLDPAGVTLAGVRGVGGAARSVSVWLLPLKASAVGDASGRDGLRGHTLYVVGVARRDGQAVAFEGGLTLPQEEQQQLIAGIAADLDLSDGARAMIEVAPAAWLLDAHFDRLTEADPDTGRLLIAPDTQPYNAWRIGARSARAFRVLAWAE
jgi:hypothetical protein